ncbi:MAG: hypothetical protein JW837_02830 [Sedimentisphaerales bacterium]|nr:hypothetical protein [Sedimentisphaerales bacterium]
MIKKVLITVKAYPNPSKKYGETVCVAGIDLSTNKWIRLYPVTYRDLEFPKRFRKYDIIEVKCDKAKNDHRVESYKIDIDTIKIVDHISYKNNWKDRKSVLLPTVSKSFCDILKSIEENKSLGMFKPCQVDFSWQKASAVDEKKRESCYSQLQFFSEQKEAIEKIPFDFHYSFKCFNNPDCNEHKLPIFDWEIVESYRKWRHIYKTQDILLSKIKEKWLTRICSEENDLYFFAGNTQRFRNQFMVLGAFYPKIAK